MIDADVSDTIIFDFENHSFAEMVQQCARDALWPIVRRTVPTPASLLEAGAGSGRWMKFLSDQGYQVRGTELGAAEVTRFRAAYPEIPYDVADIRALPYCDASFDGVLSLGVFEHMIDGPGRASLEMARVLKPGGVAFFTVPHANGLFVIERVLDRLKFALLRSNGLRKLIGRKPADYLRDAESARLRETARRALPGLPIKYQFEPSRGVAFYEYRYRVEQAKALLTASGLVVETVHLLYGMDRIFQVFGKAAATMVEGQVRLNALGLAIEKILPAAWSAHMVLLIARKPDA